MSLRVAITGTFEVRREVVENNIKALGHKIVRMGPRANLLIVGIKTASEKKIEAARRLNTPMIWNVRQAVILHYLADVEKVDAIKEIQIK